MSTKVDPNKIHELAVESKRLSRIIEDGERGLNREILRLISDTEARYDESYVRANTREMEILLKEIRFLAESVTSQLNAKSNALIQAANQYRDAEEKAKRVFKPKSNLSLPKNDLLALPPGVTPLKTNLSINPKVYSEGVKKLQQKLKDLGYEVEVDGYFGKQTLAAVNAYKKKYGLANTGQYAGVVGNQTWLYLFGKLTGELKFDPKKYSAQVKMAQIRLKDKGYSVDVTGYFDEKTLKAVNEFKKKNKLDNTDKWKGVIGPQTWSVLFGSTGISNKVSESTPNGKFTDKNFWEERKDKWINPIKGGWSVDPKAGARYFGAPRSNGKITHAGIDFVVPPGTHVIAMTDGVVTGISKNFYGGTDAVEVRIQMEQLSVTRKYQFLLR